jgi:hypothetical protein
LSKNVVIAGHHDTPKFRTTPLAMGAFASAIVFSRCGSRQASGFADPDQVDFGVARKDQ